MTTEHAKKLDTLRMAEIAAQVGHVESATTHVIDGINAGVIGYRQAKKIMIQARENFRPPTTFLPKLRP